MELVYVASPYWHEDEGIREFRFKMVREALRQLIEMHPDGKTKFYSPVHDWHELSSEMLAVDYWYSYGLDMMGRSDRLLVLCINGWQQSGGVMLEIADALSIEMDIEYWHFRSDGVLAHLKTQTPGGMVADVMSQLRLAAAQVVLDRHRAVGKIRYAKDVDIAAVEAADEELEIAYEWLRRAIDWKP